MKLRDLMSQEDLAREDAWAEELKKTQRAFFLRVQQGVDLVGKPKERKALYQKWRQEFGDDTARSSAKTVESIMSGKFSFEDYKKFEHEPVCISMYKSV